MKLRTKKAFINGKIFTCNEAEPWAEDLYIEGNRILRVGTKGSIDELLDDQTEVVDLKGKLVLPGFIDCHVHFMIGGSYLNNLDLSNVKSKDQFREAVGSFANSKQDEWIVGGNWDQEQFSDTTLPTKEWIDDLTSNIPLFLARSDLHMALANSHAMKLAGISSDTPNPEGGLIDRDKKSGEPTGILRDNAMQLIQKVIPEPNDANRNMALNSALKEAKINGITSIHDIARAGDIQLYQEFLRDNKLTCRIYSTLPLSDYDLFIKTGIARSFGNEYLKIGALKAFADGSLGSSTAWFFDPYEDDATTCGLPMDIVENGNLKRWANTADKNKLQLVIHAIGDRAISSVLDVFEDINSNNGVWDRRFKMEHVQHIRSEDIIRMKKMNVIASVQPYGVYDDGPWCEKKIGKGRFAGSYAFKTLLDSGIKVCGGSDWTVTPLNVISGIHAAVTRETKDYKNPNGWLPNEKLSVEEAVKIYTINAAYASFEENIKGSIESGKLADIVVLSDDIFSIPAMEIKDTQVLLTCFDGEIIYENG